MALFDLELADGRKLWAGRALVNGTYAGLLEGYPVARLNDGIVERVAAEAAQALGRWPVHLVEPPRTVADREPTAAFGPEERLPACWIAVAFDSTPMGETSHGSTAIVIWFQEQPYPFPDDSVMLRLRNLPWERFAEDFED